MKIKCRLGLHKWRWVRVQDGLTYHTWHLSKECFECGKFTQVWTRNSKLKDRAGEDILND